MPRPVAVSLQIASSAPQAALDAAQFFTDAVEAAITARGLARVAISGGSTPKAMFQILADSSHPYVARIPWQKLQLFWVDERCVPPTDPESNFHMTTEAMLAKVPLPPENIHRMEGELDPAAAAARYEAALRTAFRLEGAQTPTFDLVLLGMGPDGHTASLFPHTEGLHNITDLVIANHVPQKDTWRITLTSSVINQARQVVFQVQGADKAEVVAKVLVGPYLPESYPSQLIRPFNGRLTFMLDGAAAANLPSTATLQLT